MLYANAPLVADRKLIVVNGKTSDVRSIDRTASCSAAGKCDARVRQRYAVEGDAQTERDVGAGVVHVVALDALVHCAEAAANHGLAAASQVIGKADARTEGGPVIVH